MSTAADLLAQANACHDDDVPRGAELLRGIDPAELPPTQTPTYAFLLNHVLGEKLGAWPEALQLHQRLLALPSPAVVLWRQAGAAAVAAGNHAAVQQAAAAYATANTADPARALEVLHLGAAIFRIPGSDAATAARLTEDAIAPLAAAEWDAVGPIDSAVAACLNNIASHLQDRPLPDLREPALRDALQHSAGLAHRFWLRAGNWVNAERALYLLAMVGNALGDPQAARGHALDALALLDRHDAEHAEDVDRAFVELEHAHACNALFLHDEAAAASKAALALAAVFNDGGLTNWFESRRTRLALLPA